MTIGFVLISKIILGQTQISGGIKNDQNEVLAYTSLGIKSTKIGSISDKSGNYNLVLDNEIKMSDSVVINHPGYQSKMISIDELRQNSNIILSQKSTDIEAVVIKYQKLKDKIIGEKKRPFLTFTKFFDQNHPTIEQGNIFKIYSTTKIQAYNFFIMPSSRFQEITLKLNIYNLKNNSPDQQLLSENIIYTSSSTGWQHIDLSELNLMLKNVDQIAVTLQLVDFKKLSDEDFVFGISAKKSLAKNLLFRHQSQGLWEKSDGQFISNLEIKYDKTPVETVIDKDTSL